MEILKNKQIKANKIINVYNSKVFGKIRSPRPAAIYSETPTTGKKLAPLLGENSLEILKELNFTKEEISTLLKEKVISK